MSDWAPLLHPLLQRLKENADAAAEKISVLEALNETAKQEIRLSKIRLNHLERYNEELEARIGALHEVLDRFIDNSTEAARRNLLGEFEAVAEDFGVDLREVIDLTNEDEDIDEFMADLMGVDQ